MKPVLSRLGALVTVVVLAALPGAPAGAGLNEANPVELPVTFHVKNTNNSQVPCPSDDRPYDISGHLVMSPGTTPPGVTLYLHGLGHGEWLWAFDAVPGHHHAVEMARLGQASVVVDRLGYDRSGHPQGTQTCVGAQADVTHQIVQALRSGDYDIQGESPQAFSRVALAGLSAGGMIAQIEAYSFGDVHALIVMAYADQGASQATFQTLFAAGGVCLRGGQQAESGQPGGYAYFGQTEVDFKALMFHDADPAVVAAATPRRNRDPCGDYGSLTTGVVSNQLRLGGLTLPVLVACGRNDAVFPPPACEDQVRHFRASSDATGLFLGDTGHMLPLERTAPQLHAALATWLHTHGI